MITKKQVDVIYACRKREKIKCSLSLIKNLYKIQAGEYKLLDDYKEKFMDEFNSAIFLLREEDYFLAQFSIDYLDDIKRYCFKSKE